MQIEFLGMRSVSVSVILILMSALGTESVWAELKGGGGKTYRKPKPLEDCPVEATCGDPPKAVSKGGHQREILGISKGLHKRNGEGRGGKTY